MASREAIIAELQRRGVSVPAAGGAPVQSAPQQPATPTIPREAIIAELKRRGVAIPGQPEEPGMLSQIGRQVGLAGRYAVEGALSLPGIIANAGAGLSNAVLGTRFPDQNANISQGLSKLGFPEPQGTTERLIAHPSRAIAGVGGGAALAKTVEGGLTGAARAVTDGLQANLATQAQSAAGAGLGVGVAQEGGASPGVQALAGVAGGVLAPAAVQVPVAGARAVKALIQPMTQSGQRQIVGQQLNMAASNRTGAMQNLRNADEIVQGSAPTTGEAARDLGLIGLQKTVTERSKGMGEGMPFGDRAQAQNAARLEALEKATGSTQLVTGMQRARNALTTGMREEALSRANGPVDITPVMAKIDAILASPEGARSAVQKAMVLAKNMVAQEAQREGGANARRLYEIGKDINKTILDQLKKEDPGAAIARGSLSSVRRELYDAIDGVAPGFKDYLTDYAKLSKPIDQLKQAQKTLSKTSLAPTDVNGNPILSQAKWSERVKYALPELKASGALSSKQLEVLTKIGDDLDRGALLTSPFAKSTGSDTLRNLTGANLVGAMGKGNVDALGPIVGSAMAPINFLYRIPNKQMERLLQESMLDPKLALKLMSEATPKNMFNLGTMLRDKAKAMGISIPRTDTTEREKDE